MSGTWTSEMMQFVEEHIDRLSLAAANVAGVVQEVAVDRLSATVVFDGSTVGVPVKCLGHVWPLAGDRVLVSRVGPRRRRKVPDEAYAGEEWVVVGVASRTVGPNVAVANFSQGNGTTTTTTIADLPGTPTFQFVKRSDTTPVLMYLSFTAAISVANSTVGGYLNFTQGSTVHQIKVAEIESSISTVKFGPAHFRMAPDSGGAPTLASGTWNVKVQWARTASGGAGVITSSAGGDDHASALVMELGT